MIDLLKSLRNGRRLRRRRRGEYRVTPDGRIISSVKSLVNSSEVRRHFETLDLLIKQGRIHLVNEP